MTERGVHSDLVFDYLQAEPDEHGDGWYGHDHDPGTEPIPVADIHDRLKHPSELLDDQPERLEDPPQQSAWDDYDATPADPGHPTPLRSRPIGSDFADSFRALTFKAPTTPWYRTKKALIAAAAVAAVAAVGLLIIRMPGEASEESTTVAPNASTSAAPGPTTAQPTLTHVESTPPAPLPPLPLPPPPPPPPPLPTEPASPPVYRGGSQWEPSAPSSQKPPQIDVTRAPISVAPPPRPAPKHDSATPGDGPKRWGGWGW